MCATPTRNVAGLRSGLELLSHLESPRTIVETVPTRVDAGARPEAPRTTRMTAVGFSSGLAPLAFAPPRLATHKHGWSQPRAHEWWSKRTPSAMSIKSVRPVLERWRSVAADQLEDASSRARGKVKLQKLLGPPTKVTQFAAPIKKLSLLVLYSLAACVYAPRMPLLPLVPLPYIVGKTTEGAILTKRQRLAITMTLTTVWGGLLIALATPLVMAVGLPARFATLAVYSPFLVVFGRKNHERYSWLARQYMHVCWDPPLIFTALFAHHVLRARRLQVGARSRRPLPRPQKILTRVCFSAAGFSPHAPSRSPR